jgi:hypothetical protein
MLRFCLALFAAALAALPASAAEVVVLTHENWAKYAPPGKEADCILGDYVLKSDKVWAVVAQPAPWRNANMTVRQVGGAVIDLTTTTNPNDQLSAFYPGMRKHVFTQAKIHNGAKFADLILHAPAQEAKPAKPAVGHKPAEPAVPRQPEVLLRYRLMDGEPELSIQSFFKNTFAEPLEIVFEDELRADNFDAKARNGIHRADLQLPNRLSELFWVHDRYFNQAYAVKVEFGGVIRSISDASRVSKLEYLPEDTKLGDTTTSNKYSCGPGNSLQLVRELLPGPDVLTIKGELMRESGPGMLSFQCDLRDEAGAPVAGAELTIKHGEENWGTMRTDAKGLANVPVFGTGEYEVTARSPGSGSKRELVNVVAQAPKVVKIVMPVAPVILAEITNANGGPTPCKVQFKGVNGTQNPNWGPPSAIHAVNNLYYSQNGKFTVPIAPGEYEAIISYGVEHDVVRIPLKVEKAQKVPLKAVLKRTVQSPGWVSADFHSHSSPSGDNTTDQRGRVLNLLCENIEFAPCTEHNRIDSYTPHLKALGVEKLMGTCTGIELTGTPLPLNHQNSFPLKWKPRTQDGGAPVTDYDPPVQIRRLADWDDGGEKLVQQNHPDIGWLFFDKDGNGEPDDGYKAGFPYMHVIEVHPISEVLDMQPIKIVTTTQGKKETRNETIFNWLQLLNQGYRIPGVVNTDAHYNFHGSGGLFNFVRCDVPKTPPTPPSQGGEEVMGDIDPLDIVRHCKKGHIVMSTGPFLEVKLDTAIPGDEILLERGKGELHIRVQCPNWFDIDRVQVLINGRPDPKLNFTRKDNAAMFSDKVVKFDQKLKLAVDKDAHVIVVAIGEESTLGEVMGPMWGKQHPVAISNPIFVDVDGGGFKPNGDTLGAPLPVKAQKPVTEAKP